MKTSSIPFYLIGPVWSNHLPNFLLQTAMCDKSIPAWAGNYICSSTPSSARKYSRMAMDEALFKAPNWCWLCNLLQHGDKLAKNFRRARTCMRLLNIFVDSIVLFDSLFRSILTNQQVLKVCQYLKPQTLPVCPLNVLRPQITVSNS